MTLKEMVLERIRVEKGGGLSAPELLTSFVSPCSGPWKPQSIYPCFTQLCKEGLILDSTKRRKSPAGRNSIVWVDKKYGGVQPVWQSGHPTYSYDKRAKVVMDLLAARKGGFTVPEMVGQHSDLQPMATSSLVSALVRQGWLHRTNKRRAYGLAGARRCVVFDLTPRGRQIREGSPRVKADTPGRTTLFHHINLGSEIEV